MSAAKPRVLVVDDEPEIAALLAEEIAHLGYATAFVTNAADALPKLRDAAFDVLVTDVRMPEVSGLELVRALRARGDRVPVIFLTGYAELEHQPAADTLVVATLAKPIDFDALTAALVRATGG